MVIEEDLGCKVFGGATEGVGESVGGQVGLGQAEIAENDMACRVEEDVLGFEVAMGGGRERVSQRSRVRERGGKAKKKATHR